MMSEDGLGVEHVAKNDRSIYLSVVSVLVELVELLISILTNVWWRTQIRQKNNYRCISYLVVQDQLTFGGQ